MGYECVVGFFLYDYLVFGLIKSTFALAFRKRVAVAGATSLKFKEINS